MKLCLEQRAWREDNRVCPKDHQAKDHLQASEDHHLAKEDQEGQEDQADLQDQEDHHQALEGHQEEAHLQDILNTVVHLQEAQAVQAFQVVQVVQEDKEAHQTDLLQVKVVNHKITCLAIQTLLVENECT